MSSEVVVLLGSIGRSQVLMDAIVRIAGSEKLEGLGALSRLGLEGFLLFVYSNLLFSGSIYRLEGGGEVFHQVLRFPFR